MRLTFSFFLIVKNISYNFLRETMLTSIPPHPQGDGESSRHTLNADCNGSANIGRKIIPNMNNEWDRSVAATPVIVNPLRSKKLSVCV